jgi:DNA invertase Pin-like site-specific DNA recombinase
LGPFECLEKQ